MRWHTVLDLVALYALYVVVGFVVGIELNSGKPSYLYAILVGLPVGFEIMRRWKE